MATSLNIPPNKNGLITHSINHGLSGHFLVHHDVNTTKRDTECLVKKLKNNNVLSWIHLAWAATLAHVISTLSQSVTPLTKKLTLTLTLILSQEDFSGNIPVFFRSSPKSSLTRHFGNNICVKGCNYVSGNFKINTISLSG